MFPHINANFFRLLLLLFYGVIQFHAKKIAFMFVIQRELPFEDIWREFFTWHADRADFRIYVHAHPKFHFSRYSFFSNSQVPNRLSVQWGSLSLVAANQMLVREALKDPENEFFALFSETCIPVQPFSVWKKLLDHNKSLIHACTHKEDRTNTNRWNDQLGLPIEMWRKTENWFGIIRKHAEIFASMNISKWENVFAADEHILASTIAAMGLENETTCGYMTRVSWNLTVNVAHPLSLTEKNITKDLLLGLHSPGPGGYHFPCSGIPNICHFSARKFDRTAAKPLFDNLHLLFDDDTDADAAHSHTSYDNLQYYRLFPTLRQDPHHKNRFYAINPTKSLRCLIPSRNVLSVATKHSSHAKYYLAGIPMLHTDTEGMWNVGVFLSKTNVCDEENALIEE